MRRVVLMYGLFEPSARHVDRLRQLFDEVTVAHDEPSAVEGAREAEVIFGHRYLRQSLVGARRLRWVQTTAGGVDRLPCREIHELGAILTRVTFTAEIIGRHAVVLAWSLNRRIPEAVARQKAGTWIPEFNWLPLPKNAAVFGVGPIGQEIARLLHQDGIAVHGVRRSQTAKKVGEPFATIRSITDAPDLLSQIDWCFFALPENAESHGWLNATQIARLPRHAIVVNVGRGGAIVTHDLCAALRGGRLGGAALDVLEPKPLDSADPLWQTPGLLITPHVAAHYAERQADMEAFAEAQAERYLRGELLKNIVPYGVVS
jgi:phosphoglycerate dehydrogenase-like enzyme